MFWGLKFELLKLKIHQNAKLLLYMAPNTDTTKMEAIHDPCSLKAATSS